MHLHMRFRSTLILYAGSVAVQSQYLLQYNTMLHTTLHTGVLVILK